MPKKKRNVFKRISKFFKRYFGAFIGIALMILWGCVTRWMVYVWPVVIVIGISVFLVESGSEKRAEKEKKAKVIASIENKIEALQKFKPEEKVIEAAKGRETEIIELNTDNQLFQKGVDSFGKNIVPDYTPVTKRIKRLKSQPIDRVTLKDTGDFHQSFKIQFEKDEFFIYADDEKTNELGFKYGFDIFGLTPANVLEVAEIVKPDFVEDFRNALL